MKLLLMDLISFLKKLGSKITISGRKITIYKPKSENKKVNHKIIIQNFLKDHRVFMTSVIAALVFGGEWKISDKDSINTSFPSFLRKIDELGGNIQ